MTPLLHQAQANVTALFGERPRGGRYGAGEFYAAYPPFDAGRFMADLEATFAGRRWDRLVKAELRCLEALAKAGGAS